MATAIEDNIYKVSKDSVFYQFAIEGLLWSVNVAENVNIWTLSDITTHDIIAMVRGCLAHKIKLASEQSVMAQTQLADAESDLNEADSVFSKY